MSILLNAAVATADGVVYNLATRLFEGRKSPEPVLLLSRPPRCAEVVVLVDLLVISATLIWEKLTGRLPRIVSTSTLISLLTCAATVAWVMITHIPNFSKAGAHASLKLLKSAPFNFSRASIFWLFQVKREFWSYSPLSQVMICHSGVTIFASCFFFIGGYLPASFSWAALCNAPGCL